MEIRERQGSLAQLEVMAMRITQSYWSSLLQSEIRKIIPSHLCLRARIFLLAAVFLSLLLSPAGPHLPAARRGAPHPPVAIGTPQPTGLRTRCQTGRAMSPLLRLRANALSHSQPTWKLARLFQPGGQWFRDRLGLDRRAYDQRGRSDERLRRNPAVCSRGKRER